MLIKDRIGPGQDPSVAGTDLRSMLPIESTATGSVSTTDGRRVAYETYGKPDGAPVVFLHGTPGSRLLGGVLDAPARDRGLAVLAIDRPGYGESDPWPGFGPADTGALVEPVLADAGVDRAGVVAFSGGAPDALALAAVRPDLVTSVDLVSGAPPPSVEAPLPGRMRLLATLARRTPQLVGGLFGLQARLARSRPSVVVDQYTDRSPSAAVAERVAADFVEGVGAGRDGLLRELRRVRGSWPVALSGIERPVRLWHGDRDGNVPIAGPRRTSERLPDATLTVVGGSDHLGTLLERREAVLSEHAPPADHFSSSSNSTS